ncbi:MAG: PAS domain-containing protein, partial [Defluviitaleaceae bacterium]|nr:PAS domain-containing protein [Defluviitaleaceae bacterium]
MITSEREASALAQTILNSAPFFIEFWDADGNMLECNDKMLRVFEVTDKHAFAKNFFDFCVPIQPCGTPAVQLNDKMIQIAMEQGSTRAEWLYLMPDGSELPVEAVWVHAHHNGKPIIIVYSIDLRPVKTAMEREQAAIAKERKAFETIQQIFDLAPTMINQWDSNYNMIKSSRKAVEWYGVSSEQEYIDRFGDLAPECQPCGTPTLQKAKEFVAEAFEKGSASFEWMTLTTNGEPLPLWVDLVRASTDEGAIVYAFTNDLRPIEAIKGKAYEAEKKQREQFQIIVDASPYMCTVFDEIGNVIDCNKVTLDYFELSSKQEYMGCFHDLIPEYQPNGTHSATAVIENTKRVIKTGELLTYFNWVMHTKSGEPRHMEVIKTAVIISGEIHVIVYARDLQEHFRMVAAEEALHKKEFEYELQKQKQEAHEWNQAFIDNSPHIISIWNSDMKLAMASKAAVERFGIESPEVFIEQFGDFSPKYQPCGALSSELAVSYMQQAMDEGSVTFEWMHKTADGDPRPSEIVAKRFTRNDENVVIVFNSDLREIKAAEEKERVLREELLYREKLLAAGNQTAKVLLTASTIDTIMDGMEIIGHLLNVDRTQIWHFGEVNGEGCFMLQYEWLSERGKQKNGYPKGFVYPRSRDAEWFDNTLLAGVNINCPISELPPVIEAYYGGFDVVSTAIFPMILNDEIVGIFAVQDCELVRTFTKDEMDIMASTGMMFTSVYNNIKQQEERQRMKIAEESNHAKSVFLARMSHEIRTPISAVMGISEIELQSRELDARTEEAFAKIHNSANSLLGLVNDILDLSKIEAGKMELTTSKYKMSHVILDISQIHLAFVGSRDIKFIMQVDETLPQYLVGDPLRIVQIASNVLSNAFKYTMEGTVHLSFSCEQRSRDKITLVLAVRDSGLGMSDEQL